MGRWRHRFGKYADSLSTCKWEGCVFVFLHPETHSQKGAFSGSVWTVGQNDAIHVCFSQKRVFVWTAYKATVFTFISFIFIFTSSYAVNKPTHHPVCAAVCFHNSLLCVGVIHLTVVEDPAGQIVAHRPSADVDEPVGLH